jgi:geranylgeranylglycerol-phosphate geranylgeranyltransferase
MLSGAVQRPVLMLRDGWKLVRGLSCMGAAATAVLGAYLYGGFPAVLSARTAEAVAVVAAVVGSSNAINDIRDVDNDRVDKPDRPLPAGRLSPRTAFGIATASAAAALGLAAFISLPAAAQAIVTLLVGWLYSFRLKGTVLIGNAVAALLDGYCVTFGALCTGGLSGRVIVASIFVFLFCFAYLVLHTARDYYADQVAAIRTVATVLGERNAILVFEFLAIATSIALILPALLGWFSSNYLIAILVTVVCPMLTAALLVGIKTGATAIAAAILILRLSWFPGIAGLMLLR